MNLQKDDRLLIEKWIDKSLSEAETEAFEKRKEESEEFQKAMQFQLALVSSLQRAHKHKLKKELRGMLDDVDPSEVKSQPMISTWLLAAASVVVLLGAIWIFQPTGSSSLFDEYYDPYPAQITTRGESSNTEVEEILQMYADGNYEEVIQAIEDQIASAQSFDGQQLYLGNAYLSTLKTEMAIKSFHTIEEGNRYYFDAQWYLALSYLRISENQDAIRILSDLEAKNSVYGSSARELLEDLK